MEVFGEEYKTYMQRRGDYPRDSAAQNLEAGLGRGFSARLIFD